MTFRDRMNAVSAEHLVFRNGIETNDEVFHIRKGDSYKEYNEAALSHARILDIRERRCHEVHSFSGAYGPADHVYDVIRVYEEHNDILPTARTTICFGAGRFKFDGILETVVLQASVREWVTALIPTDNCAIMQLVLICPIKDGYEAVLHLVEDLALIFSIMSVGEICVLDMVARRLYDGDVSYRAAQKVYQELFVSLVVDTALEEYGREEDKLPFWHFCSRREYAEGLSEEVKFLTFEEDSDYDSEGYDNLGNSHWSEDMEIDGEVSSEWAVVTE